MNIFNKIVVIIILLFFIFVSFLSIVNVFVDFFKWSDIAAKVFNPVHKMPAVGSVLALLMVIVVCIFLLLLEFYRRKVKIAKIYNVESGKAMITLATISQQIKDAVIKIWGVKSIKSAIISKTNGIIINMMVELGQSVNIPEKMNEIINSARDVSINRLNIKVIDTKLTIVNLLPDEGVEPKAPVVKVEQKVAEKENKPEVSEEPDQKPDSD